MSPKLVWLHCKSQLLTGLREPSFVVPIVVFPSLFYLFFGLPAASSADEANRVLGSYATYAVLAVMFNQFTAGIAQGRMQVWEDYLRILPASFGHRMAGWLAAGLVIGMVSFLLVAVCAVTLTPVDAGPAQWGFLGLAVLFGSIPMVLLAASFGLWLMPKAAMTIATLVYFLLTYAGGIWASPDELPDWLQSISPFLPTRLWGELAWSSVEAVAWNRAHWLGTLAYGLLFGALAFWGYRREITSRHA
jgi:ABC-2 type transport system permease protein